MTGGFNTVNQQDFFCRFFLLYSDPHGAMGLMKKKKGEMMLFIISPFFFLGCCYPNGYL
jgi:hypothetical protein